MALTVTVFDRSVEGKHVKVKGKYVLDGGSTGGDIVTGLKTVLGITLQPKGAAVVANQPAVNETFPLSNSNGAVTFITTADQEGTFEAYGLGY